MRNFRTETTKREVIDETNILLSDLVEAFKLVSEDLARYEMTNDTRFISLTCRKLDLLGERKDMLKRALRAESAQQNKDQDRLRKLHSGELAEKKEAERQQRLQDRQARKEENRRLHREQWLGRGAPGAVVRRDG